MAMETSRSFHSNRGRDTTTCPVFGCPGISMETGGQIWRISGEVVPQMCGFPETILDSRLTPSVLGPAMDSEAGRGMSAISTEMGGQTYFTCAVIMSMFGARMGPDHLSSMRLYPSTLAAPRV